jgi:hypothetical protein
MFSDGKWSKYLSSTTNHSKYCISDASKQNGAQAVKKDNPETTKGTTQK